MAKETQEPPRAQRMVRGDELKSFTGLGPTQIAELIRRDLFPQPVRVGLRVKAWPLDKIAAWQAERERQTAVERERIERGELTRQPPPKRKRTSQPGRKS